jgi:DNA repair protein RadC
MPIPVIKCMRESRAPYDRRTALKDDNAAAGAARAIIGDPDREHFVTVHLDRKHRVLSAEVTAIGVQSAVLVAPREVFRAAIAADAAAIVVAHNHPSGDPNPSPEDRELTRKLIEAGELLGIPVLDHVVLGDEDAAVAHVSLRKHFPALGWA